MLTYRPSEKTALLKMNLTPLFFTYVRGRWRGIHERSPVRNAQASSRTVLRKGYWGNKRFLSFRKGSSDIRKARSSFTEKRTFLPVLLAKWNKNESYLKKTQKLTETTSYVNETKNVHFSLCPKYLFWPCLVPDKYSMKKTKTNAKS